MNSPWNSPSQNTGVGSLSLLQGIFPTQGSNPGLPHCRQTLYQLSHKGSYQVSTNCISLECNRHSSRLSPFLSEHVHFLSLPLCLLLKNTTGVLEVKTLLWWCASCPTFWPPEVKKGCRMKAFCHQSIKTWMGTCKKEGPLEEDLPDLCVLIEYLQGWSLAILYLCRVFLCLGKSEVSYNYYL